MGYCCGSNDGYQVDDLFAKTTEGRLAEGISVGRLVFGRLRDEAVGSLMLKREPKY